MAVDGQSDLAHTARTPDRAFDRWQFFLESSTPDAKLADADPEQVGGLYDRAEALYEHFATPRIDRVGSAKISKCLYLMRPHLA